MEVKIRGDTMVEKYKTVDNVKRVAHVERGDDVVVLCEYYGGGSDWFYGTISEVKDEKDEWGF